MALSRKKTPEVFMAEIVYSFERVAFCQVSKLGSTEVGLVVSGSWAFTHVTEVKTTASEAQNRNKNLSMVSYSNQSIFAGNPYGSPLTAAN
jgi:hypothetical protein